VRPAEESQENALFRIDEKGAPIGLISDESKVSERKTRDRKRHAH